MDDKAKAIKIDAAISAHMAWFERLSKAIQSKQSEFNPTTVSQDNQCDFGKWIHSDLKNICDEKTFTAIKDCHASFHKQAAEVLTLAIKGEGQKAQTQIDAPGGVKQLSGKLIMSLRRL